MSNRRRRQSRQGQKHAATPADLRTRRRPRAVRTVNFRDVEMHAAILRSVGFPCEDCGAVSRFAFAVDHAIRYDSGTIPGLGEKLRTLRRHFGAACIVLLCDNCSTIDALILSGENWDLARRY